ncbi:MAG: dihydroorotase, partial [Sphingobacteriales bacterium]
MNLLLKGVTVADGASAHNGQKCDIRIEDGHITEIGKITPKQDEQVLNGGTVSPGFFDLNSVSGDPGYETREDLNTLMAAAAAGGFTGVAVLPLTKPVV